MQNLCHKGENYNSVFIIGKHLSGSIFGSFESARGGGDCLRCIVALIHPHLAKYSSSNALSPLIEIRTETFTTTKSDSKGLEE